MIKILTAAIATALFVVFLVNNIDKNSKDVVTPVNTETSEQPSKSEGEGLSNSDNVVQIEKPVVNPGKILDLSNSGLSQTPDYVFERTDIQELNLSNNNLSGALQAEVRQLQNLKTLDLSGNNFTGVPAEVGQLQKLEVLNLSNNNLTGLPYELGNLRSLKVLNLKGNNHSVQDLNVIKESLSNTTIIQTD